MLSSALFAQNIRCYVNADRITTDESLVLTLEIKGSQRASTPRFPAVDGFQAAGVSTRSQFINGAMSVAFSQTYYPKKEGTSTIPSFSYNFNGKAFQSPEFTIKVTKGTGRPKQQAQQRNPFDDFFKDSFFGDPFGRRQQNQEPKQLNFESVNADYFLAVNTNKEECFLGEQILGEVVLYINQRDQGKIQVGPMEIGEMQQRIKNNAFWEEIIEFQEIPMNRVTIKGKNYIAYTLYRTVLFPIQSGEIKFENVWLDAKKLAVATNASPFDQFFMNTTKYDPIKIYAGPKKITVKNLPPTDLPNAHSVGKYKLKASLTESSVNTGEPLTLKVNIKGNGNTNLIPEPEVNFPKNFDVYEPTSNISTHKSENVLYGEKDIEYTFVPTEPGDYNLGPLKFYYFDPNKNDYDSLEVPNLPLRVSGEALNEMMLKNSSLDRFYSSAMENASDHVPGGFPFKKGLFLGCIALLIGAVGFRVVKDRKKA
ncbi:MAG: protein BatD [Bacteroidia bacterium]|nr:protein BatD [Bacteroidia bacterium]